LRIPASLIVVLALLGGCATAPPTQTQLMKEAGSSAFTKRQLETVMFRFGYHYAGQVELVAEEIWRASPDPTIRDRVITWATLGVSEVMRVSFNHEPFVGMIQAWMRVELMLEYVETGLGRDHFGPHQDQVIEVSRRLNADIEDIAAAALPPDIYQEAADGIARYVQKNPLDNHRYVTRGLDAKLLEAMSQSVRGGLGAAGEMAEQMVGMVDRANLLMAYMPRQVQWQTAEALSLTRSMITDLTDSTLATVKTETDASLQRIMAFVAEQRRLATADVSRERQATLARLEQERQALQAYLTRERQGTLEAVAAERAALLAGVGELTEAAIATGAARAEAAVDRGIDRVYQRTQRLLLLPFVLLVLLTVAAMLWIRHTVNRVLARKLEPPRRQDAR
jgi:hypothetical protein